MQYLEILRYCKISLDVVLKWNYTLLDKEERDLFVVEAVLHIPVGEDQITMLFPPPSP